MNKKKSLPFVSFKQISLKMSSPYDNIKTEDEIALMSLSGKALSTALSAVMDAVFNGERQTLLLDKLAEETLLLHGATPAFKGYKPSFSVDAFPYSLCVSVNDEIVHGLPSANKILKEGDVVSFDCGANYKGYYTDSAVTVIVGEGSDSSKRLLLAGEETLKKGLSVAKRGARLGDISQAIFDASRSLGYWPAESLTGHFIGKKIHEEPNVPNTPEDFGSQNLLLVPGMTFCVEPMLCEKLPAIQVNFDGWTISTVDHGLAVHCEHTILITDQGEPLILTARGD